MTERKYSTHKKECLAIVFGCEKCRTCLEHKEFELHFVLVNEEGWRRGSPRKVDTAVSPTQVQSEE